MRLETRNFLRYWLPALGWAALIFVFSSGMFSAAHTSRILRPVLEWLFGALPDARFFLIQFLVRKTAHLVVYATLGALWFRALRGERAGWNLSWAVLALLVAMMVASGDELRQTYFRSRTGSPWDVVLDSFGGLLAQAAIYRSTRRDHPSPM